MTDTIQRDAVISRCGLFRYWLTRVWDLSLPMLVVCMLNPSTADNEKDDRTVSNLTHFAKLWGYGGLLIVNLRAYRTSRPALMFADQARGLDTRGPENKEYWNKALGYAWKNRRPVLIAWGNNAREEDSAAFLELCTEAGIEMICFGKTKDGNPTHPAARGQHAVPRDQQPVAWKIAA